MAHLRKAPHVGAGWAEVIRLMREAMSGDRLLSHVGHYTNGCEDISVHPEATPRSGDQECEPEEYLRTARLLSTFVSALDGDLGRFHTGSLLRVVLQAAPGAAYCDAVVPDQHVIAFLRVQVPSADTTLPDVPKIRPADTRTAALTTSLREMVRRRLTTIALDGASDEPDPPVSPEDPDAGVHIKGHLSGRLADQCRAVVDPGDLHHVSCWVDGEPVYAVDVLTHPGVRGLLPESDSVAHLRRSYEQLGRRFPTLVSQFGRVCHNALGGKLERVVLALEQGAIYYYRGLPGQYIVGVTLNDDEGNRSDEKVARLAVTARTL
ncbi:MAG TPA: hypothetical protein VF821_18350 [Lentzea sp.]